MIQRCRFVCIAALTCLLIALGSCKSHFQDLVHSFEPPLAYYYVVAEVDTSEHQEVAQQVIYQLEDTAFPSDRVRIEFPFDGGLQIAYSSQSDKHGLWAIADAIPTLSNQDSFLPSALYTIRDLANQNPDRIIRAIIASDGTSDEGVIASLSGAAETLAPLSNVHIAVVNVSPVHRAAFATGFSPIRDRVWFASTDEELAALFRSYGG